MSTQIREKLTLAVGKLSLTFDESTKNKFLLFIALLQKWNRVYNLTAIRSPEETLTHHILDALTVVSPLDALFAAEANQTPRILDVGSGGGIPGVVLAIARPQWQITMIDAVAKKTAFVTQAIIDLELKNARAENGRIEAYRPAMRYDLIVARAFSEMSTLIESSEMALAERGCWAAMKGVFPEEEIARLPRGVRVACVEKLIVPELSAERHLVLLERNHG
ncbi:MAG: 16S rRNA (guanine(527)-N(7))-methyltransferase RsmG [Burkholderiales bacterium]|jgi:16S rRNA (guanine527-N7)-methyltransferase|nr:16S rRNA (guanine(527)-N(7))-methyltransferase RsmG [Burkholderiales bacterium]